MMKARLKLGLILLLVGCLLCVGLSTVSANDNNTTGDFTELNNLVQNNNVINLDTDYKANDSAFYKGITISNGMNVTINGNGHTIDGNFQGRIFDIKKGGILTLNNVNLINGRATYDDASYGGAIYVNNDATLNMNNCTFIYNQAVNSGGAIYSTGTLTVNNSVFNRNRGLYGGAICSKNSLTVINSSFINNKVKYDGGAINCNSINNCFNCTFIKNQANRGGAILITGGTNILHDCIFIENAAFEMGGAVYLKGRKAHLSVIHNQFKDNYGRTYAPNIYNEGYYKTIEFNYFPDEKQNKFMEVHIFESNENHYDSHPYYNLTDYYNHGKTISVVKTTTSSDVVVKNTGATSEELSNDNSTSESTSGNGGALSNNGTVIFNKSGKIQFYNNESKEESPVIRLTTTSINTVSNNVTFNDDPVIITTGETYIKWKKNNISALRERVITTTTSPGIDNDAIIEVLTTKVSNGTTTTTENNTNNSDIVVDNTDSNSGAISGNGGAITYDDIDDKVSYWDCIPYDWLHEHGYV